MRVLAREDGQMDKLAQTGLDNEPKQTLANVTVDTVNSKILKEHQFGWVGEPWRMALCIYTTPPNALIATDPSLGLCRWQM